MSSSCTTVALGPIHYRMFGKVHAVDALARDIAAHADAEGWTSGLTEELEAAFSSLEGELEDYIDDELGIHGSVQRLVERSERALAFACEPLGAHLDGLVSFAREEGRAAGERELSAAAGLEEAWQAVDGHWLDGMPCDGLVRQLAGEPGTIAWSIELAPHTAAGYERIRAAWTAGFLETAGIELAAMAPGTYVMRKAA